MKYVKLFENWLSEADGGGGGVKPFDPSNPGATMIVDLTPKDVFKDAKTAAKTIESIINKAVAKKDGDDVPKEYKVELFKFVYPDGIGEGEDDGEKRRAQVKNIETNKIFVMSSSLADNGMKMFTKFSGESMRKTPFFIVSKVGKDYTYESKVEKYKEYPHIKLEKKEAFIIVPWEDWEEYATGTLSQRDFLGQNMKFDCTDNNDFFTNASTSIRGLIYYMSNDINISMAHDKSKDSELKTPQGIAKFFGYEIPDNYTPGQGVEKTKA